MSPIWTSLSDFMAMGGYGLYVWGSFSVVLFSVGIEGVLERRRLAQALAAGKDDDGRELSP
jgi:heme exporter protein D